MTNNNGGAATAVPPDIMRAAALGYAARGWHVLPTRGKVPRLHNGLHGATTDERAITNWWAMWPDSGIGIRTGAVSGLVVVDVDGDAGADSLHALEREHGALPETVTAITGGGGQHVYFRHPGTEIRNSAGKLGAGLDIRGDGGYVVAPPTAARRRYQWDNHPLDVGLADMPAWLRHRVREPVVQRKRTPPSGWCALLQRIPEGERNDSLARIAGHLLARDVNPNVALELLLCVNQARCKPPLPAREVLAVCESIYRCHIRNRSAA